MIKMRNFAAIISLALIFLSQAVIGVDVLIGSQQINSNEILHKIEIGKPAYYNNTTITGDLDISKLNLPKENKKSHITSPINIIDSKIEGKINFSDAIFDESVNFGGSQLGHAYFNESQFESVDFNRSQLHFAHFRGSQFEFAEFSGSILDYAEFIRSQFGRYTNFSGSQFGSADFSESQFSGYADFGESQFREKTSFLSSKFSGNTFFSGSQFSEDADFSGSQFSKMADFSGSQFSEDADFRGSQFGERSNFRGSQFSKNNFTGSRFNGYVFGWSSIIEGFDEATYLALIKNLASYGQFADSNKCYYIYRFNKLRENFDFYDFLSLISCGFGVRPEIPLFWGVVLIPLFGIIYWASNCVYRISCPIIPDKSKENRSASLSEALYFSILVFFHTHPPAFWHQSGRWRYLVTFEDILGWFFLALFVVVLVNVMITK